MKNQSVIKLFTTVKMAGDGVPSKQRGESLLAQADQEIELRVKTPFTTVSQLEQYAQDIAQVSNRVLLAVRQADWYRPFVEKENPYPGLTQKWEDWVCDQEQKRRQHPRIKIVDQELRRTIEAAQDQEALARYKRPRTDSPLEPIEILNEWVSAERVLWIARELLGITEVTFLPQSSVPKSAHPVIATFAVSKRLETIQQGIDILVTGEKPLKAAREIVWGGDGEAFRALQVHHDQRNALYRTQWEKLCSIKGYEPNKVVCPCVCRYIQHPRDFYEFVEQWAENFFYPKPHRPECYERTIETLTYWSDWSLAENHMADAVGKRHSLITYYSREIAKAQCKVAEDE